ncbi:MAG: hypothetical protein IKB93_10410 [Clostridia bacterium]|nr:hypothetical protein [Clostridia bacterium]
MTIIKTSVKCYIKPNLSPVDDAIPTGGISLGLHAIAICFYGNNKKFKKLAEKTAPPIAMLLSIIYTYLVKMVSS